jgi:hypothetical protein
MPLDDTLVNQENKEIQEHEGQDIEESKDQNIEEAEA